MFRLARVSSNPTRQSPLRETVSTAVTGDDIIFVNELGANVEADHHEQNIQYLDGNTVDVSFDHLGFQAYGNCRGRSSTPFEDYADRHLGSPSFMLCEVVSA